MRDGKPVPLAPKAIQILCILVENHGRLVERDQITSRVWPDSFVEEGNLTVNIFALRKALAEGFGSTPTIETIPRRGYRFVAPMQDPRETTPVVPVRRPLPLLWVGAILALLATAAWLLGGSPAMPKTGRVAQLTHFGLAETLGSDGVRLFAGRREGGRFSIVQVPVDGGPLVPLQLPFPDARLLDVSAVRKELLIAAADSPGHAPALWIVPSAGGAPRRLGGVTAGAARWSPDGSRIAYESDGALFTVAPDGSQSRRLTGQGGAVDAWSPDGRRIRFTRTNQATGGESIWEACADGSCLRPVFPERQMPNAVWGEGQCCGRWTPDGRHFIFREGLGSSFSLWAVAERPPLVIRRPAAAKLYAAPFEIRDWTFSPDGKRLLFVGANDSRELVRFDPARAQWVPLAVDPAAFYAAWSRDAQWLLFTTFPDRILWRARADGSARLQLTSPPMQSFGGVWSPDHTRIAFHFLVHGKPGKIAVLPMAGGKPQVLLESEPTGEDVPNWSPDGKRLLFARYWLDRDGNTTASAASLYDFDTGRVSNLAGTENLGPPAWSPDGRYVAVQSHDFHKLMLFDFQSGRWTEIASGGFVHAPQWSSDSRAIFYQDTAAAEEQPIYRIDLATRAVQRIAGRREFLRSGVARFSLSGLTPANGPIANIALSDADIYALTLDR